MLTGIVIRRLLMQSFMRPVLVIKIDPALSFPQKLSQGTIGPAFGYRELKNANEPFCVAIVGGRPCSAHRPREAFCQECHSRLLRSILAALIRMKDGARNRELHEFDRGNHQVCPHLIIKRQVHVAAHVSAQVIQDSAGKLLKFSEQSAFAGLLLRVVSDYPSPQQTNF